MAQKILSQICLAATVSIVAFAAQPAQAQSGGTSFFLTSAGPGKGADLGGIEGADKHCQSLAQATGAGTKTWHAYLSTQAADGKPAVNAKDRIGKGPWQNVKGVVIAKDVADLHGAAAGFSKESALTEKGEMVERHDILTGSKPDGTAYTDGMDHTCNGYTSNRANGSVQLGHADRSSDSSWNSAHASKGCSQANLASTGGAGQFYCFSID